MSRLVCRKCWAWYSDRETSCPRCRTPLVAVDTAPEPQAATPPVAPEDPTAPTAGLLPVPASAPPAGRGWALRLRLLLVVAIIVIAAVIAVLTLAPATTSADGAFSVRVPSGWNHKTDFVLPGGETPVLTLYGQVTDGIQAHIIVTNNHTDYIPLSQIEQVWPSIVARQVAGLPAGFTPLTTRMVGGTNGLSTEYRSSQVGFVFIIVDHANHTYLISYSAAASQFNRLRDGDFAGVINSWHWN